MKKTTFFLITALLFFTSSIHAQWVLVGGWGITTEPAGNTSLAIDSNGRLYVVYNLGGDANASVVTYTDSSGWEALGNLDFSAGNVNYPNIALDRGGTPYVAYQDEADSQKATVMKYTATGGWQTVGNQGFSVGLAGGTSIAIDTGGTPYVVYTDGADSGKATVMKYTATSGWTSVGGRGFTGRAASSTSIAIDSSGTPYVLFRDAGYNEKFTVMKYNSSAWETVGSPGFSDSIDFYQSSIVLDRNGTPYVAYNDVSSGGLCAVMKYSDAGGWVNVGAPRFGAGSFIALAIDTTGAPLVAFTDGGEDISVMRYSASSGWGYLGSPSFSPQHAVYNSIAIDRNNTPYVVYSDYSNALVEKYIGNTEVTNTGNITGTSINIFPNPGTGMFHMFISATDKKDATIIITNTLGEKVKELIAETNTDIRIQLDVPPGIYFISAVTSSSTYSEKIIVV